MAARVEYREAAPGRRRAHGLMFHHFAGGVHPRGQGAIDAAEFAAILEHAGIDRILPAAEWMARAEAGTLRDDDLCLTFDDNLRCQVDVAVPVMESLGLTAFWFVYTAVLDGGIERLEIYRMFRTVAFPDVDAFYDAFFGALAEGPDAEPVARALAGFDPAAYLQGFPFYTDADRRFRFVRDRVLGPAHYDAAMDALMARHGFDVAAAAHDLWMDEADLRRLHAAGHVVGLHSHTHPTALADLDRDAQRCEYERNRAELVRRLGSAPVAMSHPCNSYNDETLGVLRGLGVRLGFRANLAPAENPYGLEHPREDHINVLNDLRTA